MDELDMEIKDLRLQKIALHTNGFNQSTKKLEFYASKRRGDLSLPKKSFRTTSLLRDHSPDYNTARPSYDHFMTETKSIEVFQRSKISQLLGKNQKSAALRVKSPVNEEDYLSANCTFVSSPRQEL